MDHSQCLQALRGLGARSESVGLVHAFFYGQKISVKTNDSKSKPRTAPGGSPQGSILANFLFCATTNRLEGIKEVPNVQRAPSPAFTEKGIIGSFDSDRSFSPDSPTITWPDITTSTPTMRGQFSNFNPPGTLEGNLSGSFSSGDEKKCFFRVPTPGQYDSSTNSKQPEWDQKLR